MYHTRAGSASGAFESNSWLTFCNRSGLHNAQRKYRRTVLELYRVSNWVERLRYSRKAVRRLGNFTSADSRGFQYYSGA
jgi:hypothetical protein